MGAAIPNPHSPNRGSPVRACAPSRNEIGSGGGRTPDQNPGTPDLGIKDGHQRTWRKGQDAPPDVVVLDVVTQGDQAVFWAAVLSCEPRKTLALMGRFG